MLLSPGWLLITDCFDEACSLFADTLYFPSRYYRGLLRGLSLLRGLASFGSHEFHSTFFQEKLSQWEHDIMQLSKFASSQPHACYLLCNEVLPIFRNRTIPENTT